MSAAVVPFPLLLPQVQATAATGISLASNARRLHQHGQAPGKIDVQARKGPHRLTLVQARAVEAVVEPAANPTRVQPEFAFYRQYTEAMLRRYLKLSLESGRVPSLLGQEMFRGNVTHCRITGFDDAVIFVEDVNKCLRQLEPAQRFLLRKIALEGYDQAEVAAQHGIPLRTCIRRYNAGLDRLTRLLLDHNLLEPLTKLPKT